MKITEKADALLRPTVSRMGYGLDEVELKKEGGRLVLTLYIERADGSAVTIDDCEAVSRAVDPVLDAADPIGQAYFLSVSSIGLDRPLKKDRDFERNLGGEVTVKLYAPLNGKKEFTGVLADFDGESLTLKAGGGEMRILRRDAALVRPYIDFSGIEKVEIDDLEKEEK